MKIAFVLAAISVVAANAAILRRADADICRPSDPQIQVSDCEGAMSQLMDDAQHNEQVSKTHKGKFIINRGPLCDRAFRDTFEYIKVGTCTVETFSTGDAQCTDANAVVDAIDKVIQQCADGEAFMNGGEVQLGGGRGVRVVVTKQ